MKLVLSRLALAELDAILAYIAERSPLGAEHVEARVRRAFAHIARYPEAAEQVAQRPLVRRLPLAGEQLLQDLHEAPRGRRQGQRDGLSGSETRPSC